MKWQCSPADVRTWYSKEVRCWVSKCAHGTLSQHTKQPLAIESAVDACRMVDEYCRARSITRTVEP